MPPRWLKVDPYRAQISDEFLNWCEQRGIEVVDSAGNAMEQQGKVEHHVQMFELMLEDVLADVQPQTQHKWRDSLDALQGGQEQSVVSLLCLSLRCSWCSDAIQRSLQDLLCNNPDMVANSSLLHDRGAGRAARVRTVARTKLMMHSDKLNARRALDTRPRVAPTFLETWW